jgi:hypothetical protein
MIQWWLCYDIVYDIVKAIIKSLSSSFLRYFHKVLHTVHRKYVFDIRCISYDFAHDISITRWYHISFFHIIYSFDISITRYLSHTISQILWYLSLFHGSIWHYLRSAGWGRQAPSAPPPPATPSPTCWGRVFNWILWTVNQVEGET